VMNLNTWKSMPKPMQDAFWDAAQQAADEANAIDRASEAEFKKKLVAAKMEIYTPSVAEKQAWTKYGREVWTTAGKNVDKAVLDRLLKF
jgi:TRAP-type C4-dicarboxylate transport system substrate-binding protein